VNLIDKESQDKENKIVDKKKITKKKTKKTSFLSSQIQVKKTKRKKKLTF
jgi:hypothetical protein